MYRLTQLALARRPVTLLLAAALFVGGAWSWTRLQSELLPDVDFPIVTIVAPYPGAGASDVADQVSEPIEEVVSGVERVERVRSTSAASLSIVVVDLAYGTNIDETLVDIRGALDSAGLPEGVEPEARSFNINEFPVITLTASAANEGDDVASLIRGDLVEELNGVPGVAQVDVVGGEVERVEVTLDPARLAQSGVSAQAAVGVLQANELTLPSGTIEVGGETLPVTTTHRFTSLEQIRDLVVGYTGLTAPPGPPVPPGQPGASPAPGASPQPDVSPTPAAPVVPRPIRLTDIADVELALSPAAGISRANGRPAIVLSVSKSEGANTVAVTEAVRERVAEVNAASGHRLVVTEAFANADFIEESIEGLQREGGLGAAFAVLVIFLFLLNVRSTLVAAVSIPLSVMSALLLMLVGGISLNIMTLGGLAVAVGRVVDDAIVVLENIHRHHHQRGEPIRQAVLDGTREVASAITSSTLTTVAVFLPIGFVGGLITQFFLPFSLTVTFALLASLAVALTVVPVLAYYLVPRVGRGRRDPAQERAVPRDTWLQRLYTPILRRALDWPWVTLAIAAGLFAISMALVPRIPTSFLQAGSDKVLQVTVTPPTGVAREDVVDRAAEAEAIIDQRPDVISYQTTIAGEGDTGFGALQSSLFGQSASSARILVRFTDETDLAEANRTIIEQLEPVAGDGWEIGAGQLSTGASRLQIIVSGAEGDELRAASDRIIEAVAGVPDVVNVVSDLAAESPGVVVNVDPEAAIGVGLTTAQVAGEIRTILVGQTAVRAAFDDGAEPVEVFVRVDPEVLDDVDALEALPVGTVRKRPLSEIADVERIQAQATITRVDGRPAATITGDILAANTGGTSAEIRQRIDTLGLPAGVEVELAGITQQQNEGFSGLLASMAFSVLIVYVVMVLVFGSLIDPFVILFSLPLATIGAFVGLLVTGRPLGISALIGMLMLIGIVVTNAIVLLDLVEQLRARGHAARAALIEAGRTRARPILMTALATILALLPLALGFNEGSIIAAELGTVVIGGLFTSTLLTLVVVPVVYSLIEGGRERVARRLGTRPDEGDARWPEVVPGT